MHIRERDQVKNSNTVMLVSNRNRKQTNPLRHRPLQLPTEFLYQMPKNEPSIVARELVPTYRDSRLPFATSRLCVKQMPNKSLLIHEKCHKQRIPVPFCALIPPN